MSLGKRIDCPTCYGYGWKDAVKCGGDGEPTVIPCDSCNGYGFLLSLLPSVFIEEVWPSIRDATAACSGGREGGRDDAGGVDGSKYPEKRQRTQDGPGAVPGGGG